MFLRVSGFGLQRTTAFRVDSEVEDPSKWLGKDDYTVGGFGFRFRVLGYGCV